MIHMLEIRVKVQFHIGLKNFACRKPKSSSPVWSTVLPENSRPFAVQFLDIPFVRSGEVPYKISLKYDVTKLGF